MTRPEHVRLDNYPQRAAAWRARNPQPATGGWVRPADGPLPRQEPSPRLWDSAHDPTLPTSELCSQCYPATTEETR